MGSAASALYVVADRGLGPESWLKEFEPLRKQARTLIGPEVENEHFAIRFNKREEFEAAWPHLLQVKSIEAPIHLQRGKNFFLGDATAGVVVYRPPANAKHRDATRIDLVVDGEIIDLNRIPLARGQADCRRAVQGREVSAAGGRAVKSTSQSVRHSPRRQCSAAAAALHGSRWAAGQEAKRASTRKREPPEC